MSARTSSGEGEASKELVSREAGLWRLLLRAIFALDRNDHIVSAEYVADQLCGPDYAAALQAVQQSAVV